MKIISFIKIVISISCAIFFVSLPLSSKIFAQNKITINGSQPSEQDSTQEGTDKEDPLVEDSAENLQTTNSEPVINDTQLLRAEFKQYTQDPSSKIIKFEMILQANVNSDRVRATWTITGDSEYVNKSQQERVFSIQAGQTYVLPLEVRPLKPIEGQSYGVTEVFGRAEVFGVDSNAIATVRKNYASNINQEVLPLTPEYNQQKTLTTVIDVGKIAALILLASFLTMIGFRKFVKWYKKD